MPTRIALSLCAACALLATLTVSARGSTPKLYPDLLTEQNVTDVATYVHDELGP